jgi:hypothetical protein
VTHGTHISQADEALRRGTAHPVFTDAGATAKELLDRAAADYADAKARRDQLSREDRIHGNEPAAAR